MSGDLRDQAWFQFAMEIDQLLGCGEYVWAEDTLRGIQATVESSHEVTENQRAAVRRIEQSRNRSRRWNS